MTAAKQAEKSGKRRLRRKDGGTALIRSDALSLNDEEVRDIEELRNRVQTEPVVNTRK